VIRYYGVTDISDAWY